VLERTDVDKDNVNFWPRTWSVLIPPGSTVTYTTSAFSLAKPAKGYLGMAFNSPVAQVSGLDV
jgi:hypothetical protein